MLMMRERKELNGDQRRTGRISGVLENASIELGYSTNRFDDANVRFTKGSRIRKRIGSSLSIYLYIIQMMSKKWEKKSEPEREGV